MSRLPPVLLVVIACASGCVLTPELPPIQTILDQQSAVTVEAMGTPYVLACAAGGLAANARDYLDLRVLESDRMGKHVYLLSLVAFSTVDRHGHPNPTADNLDVVRLHLGQKQVELNALPDSDDAHGLSERAFPRRNGQVRAAEYSITPDLIRELAAVPVADFAIDVGRSEDLRYDPWIPAPEGLKAIAERLPRNAH